MLDEQQGNRSFLRTTAGIWLTRLTSLVNRAVIGRWNLLFVIIVFLDALLGRLLPIHFVHFDELHAFAVKIVWKLWT
ncbi:hypothetical protein BV898_03198 [Hypsibius exemplaris]|uniref:Uncharacterized protein n=1 Tax=Hypsibius exemplaris TaxID=2072580 RepID=A0A1W0X616_HYPEX|nr:hypothetical protein BV898_03198 [Hypsibius exemplaris]